MKPTPRPADVAPGGMGGIQRMPDPTEQSHDRIRRHGMSITFFVLLLVTIAQSVTREIRAEDLLTGLLMFLAGIPMGLGIKTVELRFKMAAAEWRCVLAEIRGYRRVELLATVLLALAATALLPGGAVGLLWGAWAYDFVTYYHDRPQRMRHLYNVVLILEALRTFPSPWLWGVPAFIWGVWLAVAAR